MKDTRSSLILCFASLLVLFSSAHAQAVYTASSNTRIQVGAGYMYLNPQYVPPHIDGISFWGDYDFKSFVGAEVGIHLGNIVTPNDIAENSYMVGPRAIYHKRKFAIEAKLLVGRATITNQYNNTSSTYNAYAFGGGVEYRVARKINIRAIDVEMQKWPNFYPNTLSPIAVTVGASYIIR